MCKTGEWIVYTGSDEQLHEILTSDVGFVVDSKCSTFHRSPGTRIKFKPNEENILWLKEILRLGEVKKILFCNEHPHAKMIKRWTETGQPVYYKDINSDESNPVWILCQGDPAWNRFTEYSFDPFSE